MSEEYHFPKVSRSSYKPIYIQVSEMIIDYAKFLKLNDGDPLPSENQLTSMLNVSRNTVRLAMDRLVKLNIAKTIRGRGSFFCEQKRSINLDFTQGFEGTLHQLGIKVENHIVEIRPVDRPVNWVNGLTMVDDDDQVLIRRIKLYSGNILALEERILPRYVVDRYTEKMLETENINPNLLARYPDTNSHKFKYHFVSKPLTQNEAEHLNQREGAHFLQRIGEYFNMTGDCFMVSRYIFVTSQINVSYEFENVGDFWKLT